MWPLVFGTGSYIGFAYTSFKWMNLASHNAGVTVVIVGITNKSNKMRKIFSVGNDGQPTVKEVRQINAYLVDGEAIVVEKSQAPLTEISVMNRGSGPVDGGNFFFDLSEKKSFIRKWPEAKQFVRSFSNSEEFINGKQRFCLWLDTVTLEKAIKIPEIRSRIDRVMQMRLASNKKQTQFEAATSFSFSEIRHRESEQTIVVPRVSSENRRYLPVGLLKGDVIIGDRNFALYDAPLWNMALIASRLHWVWIGTVCVRMRTDFSYSNTLGWNTFPVPMLTAQNKRDLTAGAENILLAREAHFPATIADLYDPENMPENLRLAHELNDELLERIYIGRRFKNDTERLEKVFDLYTKMIAAQKLKSSSETVKAKRKA